MAKNNGYQWDYCSVGGVVRVKVDSGEDIAHLGELDQKKWTVLSCPVKGLEFDSKTLSYLDTDNDGKIRVNEVVAASQWLCSVVKDNDSILCGASDIDLDNIDTDVPEGKVLHDSARQILKNLGKADAVKISIADSTDSVAIFAKTLFNGDGVITEASAGSDEYLQTLIKTISETIGTVTDRSGLPGITAEHIEAFYSALKDYAEWQAVAEADKDGIFPYGADTAAALAACEAVKEKVADYFMRCKLIAFDEDTAGAVDVSVEKIGAISGENLATKVDLIASYPVARPSKDCTLPLSGLNPAWQPSFNKLKSLVLKDADDAVTEGQWLAILAKFEPYKAWLASEKGTAVATLGNEAVAALLETDRKADLLALVEQDKALEKEAENIENVDKFLHLYRDFYKFLKNYVTFSDFYTRNPSDRAVFEVGRLFVDQRCCDLCIRVEDMGKHADMAAQSGMFLLYCTCSSKVKNETMNIVAVMTAGSVKNLRPGKNGIFYDLDGQDWDAVITKVVDNPISVWQAFWRPYRKFANTVSERINKSAAEKDSKVTADVTAKANSVSVPADGTAPAPAPKAPFDIAKFAGIFAAIGMAVAYLTTALAKVVNPWYNVLIVLGLLIVCISGPSMFIAWQKLRKRNIGPVLNANGWAVNSDVLVNILFGGKLTTVAKYPVAKYDDPFATPRWKKVLRWIIALVIIAFGVLYFTDNLKFMGIERKAKKAEVEVVEEAPADDAEAEAGSAEDVPAAEAETPEES